MNNACKLTLTAVLFLIPAFVRAEEAPAPGATSDVQLAKAETVEVPNKICPVSHEEVGKDGMEPSKVTYQGKTYNLCCSSCVKDFNKDPEKYSKMMDEEVQGKATN